MRKTHGDIIKILESKEDSTIAVDWEGVIGKHFHFLQLK
jgi:hypothetical protein